MPHFIVLEVLNEPCVHVQLLSRVQLFVTRWTTAHQDPLFMGFSRQEYWSGVPFLSPGDLPNPLQYSCLKNPMDGGAWWATVHWVAKSWT